MIYRAYHSDSVKIGSSGREFVFNEMVEFRNGAELTEYLKGKGFFKPWEWIDDEWIFHVEDKVW